MHQSFYSSWLWPSKQHHIEALLKRIKTMEELINSILVVKMYCWESFSLQKVIESRKRETKLLKQRAYLIGLTQCLLYFAPHIIAGITFLTALYLEDVRAFKASNVFTILTYGATLSFYMRMFQAGMYVFNETKSCNQRFQDALLLPERQTAKRDPESGARPGYARFDDYSAVYPGSTKPSIKHLDFEIKQGSLLGVVGPVGSGKSTLMNVFLDETEDFSGHKELSKNISIAPQEAWIFEGSIRDNILMGTKYDEKLYKQVTKAACLIADFNILPNGDLTLVGDKGVTLSGGQRARVGLARAIYAKADLYILDDPLAAVDPEVAAEIYEKCVQGFLKSKSRILITHQYQFLTDADNILYLDGGKQLEYGNFDKVMSYESQFINSLRKSAEDNTDRKKPEKKETVLNNKVAFQIDASKTLCHWLCIIDMIA